jgi:hypothetical protein
VSLLLAHECGFKVWSPDFEKTAQTVQIVQKFATEGRGHDFVVGQPDAVRALMKRLKRPII